MSKPSPQAETSKRAPALAALRRPEFSDPERLAFLYANILPLKERNPASYKTVIAWWHQLLNEITPEASEDQLVLHASDRLAASLATPDSGQPLSLGCVLSELSNGPKSTFIRLDEFLKSTAPIAHRHQQSWAAWVASNAVSRPLWWALGQMNIVESSQNQASSHAAALWDKFKGDWVAVELVEREAQQAMDKFRSLKAGALDRLHSLDSLRKQSCPHLSPLDVKVLLKYLSRDEQVLVYDHQQGIVKWRAPPGDETRITETDRGIVQLKSTKESLEEQVLQIENRIEKLQNDTSELVRRKQLERAKLVLRQKKGLQELLIKRQGSLATLESVWLGIETATGDAEILRAYESATATLGDVLKAPEFKRVEQTMDSLADTLADQKDIEEAMSSEHLPTSVPDDADLVQELDQLASEQPAKEGVKEPTAHDLPSVPTSKIQEKESSIKETERVPAT